MEQTIAADGDSDNEQDKEARRWLVQTGLAVKNLTSRLEEQEKQQEKQKEEMDSLRTEMKLKIEELKQALGGKGSLQDDRIEKIETTVKGQEGWKEDIDKVKSAQEKYDKSNKARAIQFGRLKVGERSWKRLFRLNRAIFENFSEQANWNKDTKRNMKKHQATNQESAPIHEQDVIGLQMWKLDMESKVTRLGTDLSRLLSEADETRSRKKPKSSEGFEKAMSSLLPWTRK
ncbi:uncharacterized protein DNG_02663 [Cephalotrichum gorgonifer]|uniref:Uncharacterized protein n=1 Tax=Cephalotrichum gorgonifer TaxID=2041049 RepID=A0AAE8MV44_9PEZI|nr:uncharacterized protein DNG_02663 [Cephalotrichum gorgonifer]